MNELDAETSNNFTIGLGGKLTNTLSFTVDYYNIAVEDRIVLGSEIGGTAFDADGKISGTTPLDDQF